MLWKPLSLGLLAGKDKGHNRTKSRTAPRVSSRGEEEWGSHGPGNAVLGWMTC